MQQQQQRSNDLDYRSTSARGMVEQALALIDQGERLTPDLWAAWIWGQTGICTAYPVVNWQREYTGGLACGNAQGYVKGPVLWRSVSEIAHCRGRWAAASAGDMQTWLWWLDNDRDRAAGYQALGVLADQGQVSEVERTRQLRLQVAMTTEGDE